MTRLAITLLGASRLELDGVPLDMTARKATALLAYLAVTGVPHTRDALATLFWPEADQEHGRGALRYTLGQLKAVLGDSWLHVTREQLGLLAHPDLFVDVVQVRALLAQVDAHGHPSRQTCANCVTLLEQVAALSRGALLAGFTLPDSPAFDDWLFFETEQLQRLQIDALAALVAYHRTAGTPAAAIPYAQRWLALDPLDETVNQLLIQLYIDSAQRAAARRHYATFTKLLYDELHTAPADETTALIEQLDRGEQQTASVNLQPLPTQSSSRQRFAATLSSPATSFLGRDHEVDAIGTMLADPSCRLLTLLGPGGSGKTRLALAVAQARQTVYVDGSLFVPLAGLLTPSAALSTLLSALGCPPDTRGNLHQHVLDYLRDMQLLLVLDNLEHLLEEDGQAGSVTTLLDDILQYAPSIQVVVTSRIRLQLYEEWVYTVQGLDYPEWEDAQGIESYGAIQLFMQRARRGQPTFTLTSSNTPAVVQIVQLLAGQPLAIELAAAWVETLSPEEIATELRSGIDLLATEARNIPSRHRSMRVTYAFSWERLRPAEQATQQALAVFRGGFTRGAAAEIAEATVQLLQNLKNHSLLASTSTSTGEIRYQLHELLRQFAAEQLARDGDQEARVRTRHANYYLGWVCEQSAALTGPQRQAVLAALEGELENVQVGWAWAVEHHNLQLIERSIHGICTLYQGRGRTPEGIAACEGVISWLDTQQPDAMNARALGQALAWRGVFTVDMLQLQQARALLERSVTLLTSPDDHHMCAFVSYALGRLAFLEGAMADAHAWLERGLAMYREHDDQVGMAQTLSLLGRVDWLTGNYAQSSCWYRDSLAMYRALNDQIGSIHVISNLATISVRIGEFDEGMRLLNQADALVQLLNNPLDIAQARHSIARGLVDNGLYPAAQAQYEAYLNIATTRTYMHAIEDRLVFAYVHLMQQHYDQVTSLAQDLFAITRTRGMQRDAGFALMLLGLVELGKGAYEQARLHLQQCLQAYQVTNTADDQNFTLFGLSHAYRGLGEKDEAGRVAMLALQKAAERRSIRASNLALAGFVGVLIDNEEIERAIELVAFLTRHAMFAHSAFYDAIVFQPLARYIAQMPPELVADAQAHGRARTHTMIDAVDELLAR